LPVSLELAHLRVVLVRTRNPLNIGAVARAMSNFGFHHLRVVNPYELAFRQARSAVGASALLANAEVYGTVDEAVADCSLVVGTTAVRNRDLHHELRPLEYGARLMRKPLASGPVALLFGSEKVGLSNADLSHCHWLVRIPTRAENISMNLGQAVAVCLYELVRDSKTKSTHLSEKAKSQESRKSQGLDPPQPAPMVEVERITRVLFDVLRATRYWNPGAGAATEEKVRRLVRRLNIPVGDAEVWLGILRQILWKIRSGEKSLP
jgi:TrmH family RNA methyltransferase